jgi:hypothetical protein
VATWNGTGFWSLEFGEKERSNFTWCPSVYPVSWLHEMIIMVRALKAGWMKGNFDMMETHQNFCSAGSLKHQLIWGCSCRQYECSKLAL